MIEVKGERFLTTDEVAEMFGIKVVTVRRQIREGKLPAVKFGKRYYIAEETIKEILSGEYWYDDDDDELDDRADVKINEE